MFPLIGKVAILARYISTKRSATPATPKIKSSEEPFTPNEA